MPVLKIYRVAEGGAAPHSLAVADVAAQLNEGALALLPTETVYGVGVSVRAFSSRCGDGARLDGARVGGVVVNGALVPGEGTGYGRIFTLKQRELTQTVPWLVDGPEALDRYGFDVPPVLRELACACWPGALTLVVPAALTVPAFMRAADGTVALRASASPVIGALVRACDSPLAVTSANTHGRPAPVSFDAVEARILHGVDVAVDAGATPCRDASTIVAARDGEPVILRQGALSAQRLAEVLGRSPRGWE